MILADTLILATYSLLADTRLSRYYTLVQAVQAVNVFVTHTALSQKRVS